LLLLLKKLLLLLKKLLLLLKRLQKKTNFWKTLSS
jgi:hypothetical protein